MGRPKVYPDAAAKQRAYRARLNAEMKLVNRRLWAALEGQVARLAEAVDEARRAGCPMAREIRGSASSTVLDSLIAWFEGQAAAARAQRAAAPPSQACEGPRRKARAQQGSRDGRNR